jgi:hypothetical protein
MPSHGDNLNNVKVVGQFFAKFEYLLIVLLKIDALWDVIKAVVIGKIFSAISEEGCTTIFKIKKSKYEGKEATALRNLGNCWKVYTG